VACVLVVAGVIAVTFMCAASAMIAGLAVAGMDIPGGVRGAGVVPTMAAQLGVLWISRLFRSTRLVLALRHGSGIVTVRVGSIWAAVCVRVGHDEMLCLSRRTCGSHSVCLDDTY
jgi:hypothetical protein